MMQVIFDCDNTMGLPFKEVDDGLVLLYLLGRPDIELLAITTTFGNGAAELAYQQTQKLLQQAGRPEIPVYIGAEARYAAPTPAARFLAEMAAQHPGKISLLATGPLGNLRGAAEIDPGFFGNLQQIACMGGCLAPLRIGRRDLPELNLAADPEAAHLVLSAGGAAACPVTLMNAQTCLQARFGWADIARLGFWPRKTRGILRLWLFAFGLFCGVAEFYLWDLLPAVYLSFPELFDNRQAAIASTVKDLETGRLVISDERSLKSITMPSRITDMNRFQSVIFEAWQAIHLLL